MRRADIWYLNLYNRMLYLCIAVFIERKHFYLVDLTSFIMALIPGFFRDNTMVDKLVYIPNGNYPFCILQLVAETFGTVSNPAEINRF